MQAMILAAGEGTRMRPLTLDRPKPMLSVAGRPALEFIVGWLRRHGITDILINLHYKPEVTMNHFGDGSRYGVHIEYSVEPFILGTSGGAKYRQEYFRGPFVVIYGDVLTDLDLSAMMAYHEQHAARPHLTLCVNHVPDPSRCGIVTMELDGRVTSFVEKPPAGAVPSDYASAGVLIVDPELLNYVPAGRFHDYGQDLFPLLIAEGVPLYGWDMPADAYLIDFGTPENYQRAQREWPTTEGARFVLEAGA